MDHSPMTAAKCNCSILLHQMLVPVAPCNSHPVQRTNDKKTIHPQAPSYVRSRGAKTGIDQRLLASANKKPSRLDSTDGLCASHPSVRCQSGCASCRLRFKPARASRVTRALPRPACHRNRTCTRQGTYAGRP
eukprot:scaffold915_cov327-Prasinococcus_capsulatus_cf.AAC.2